MIRARQYVLALGDLCMCAAALACMIAIRFGTRWDTRIVAQHVAAFSLIFPLWLIVFFVFNLYTLQLINPTPRTIGQMAAAVTTAVALSVLIFYAHPAFGILPKANLLLVGAFAFVGIVTWRRCFYMLTASAFVRSIALIGDSPEMDDLAAEIRDNPHLGKILFHAADADSLLRMDAPERFDLAIVTLATPEATAAIARTFGCSIQTLADAYQELLAKIPLSLVTDEMIASLSAQKESPAQLAVKRAAEVSIALCILMVMSPFILAAALAKKLEDGGQIVLRPHLRVGKDGRPFQFYKIRSMVMDAEKDGVRWASERDPRITPVGRVIRKLHIDELPQFWNIVKGDMSLVGPRPERPQFVSQLEKEVPYYVLRHTIKPGFTGWAQIKFRYARTVMDSRKKFEYDLYYLVNRTLLLDLGIMLKTVQIIFTH